MKENEMKYPVVVKAVLGDGGEKQYIIDSLHLAYGQLKYQDKPVDVANLIFQQKDGTEFSIFFPMESWRQLVDSQQLP